MRQIPSNVAPTYEMTARPRSLATTIWAVLVEHMRNTIVIKRTWNSKCNDECIAQPKHTQPSKIDKKESEPFGSFVHPKPHPAGEIWNIGAGFMLAVKTSGKNRTTIIVRIVVNLTSKKRNYFIDI